MTKNIGNLKDKNGNLLFPNGMETVTNSNGTALKFANGTMICYKSITGRAEITSAWGSLYETATPINLGDYPYSFVNNNIVMSVQNVGANGSWIELVTDDGTKSYIGKTYLCAPSQKTVDFNINIIAIGRWK